MALSFHRRQHRPRHRAGVGLGNLTTFYNTPWVANSNEVPNTQLAMVDPDAVPPRNDDPDRGSNGISDRAEPHAGRARGAAADQISPHSTQLLLPLGTAYDERRRAQCLWRSHMGAGRFIYQGFNENGGLGCTPRAPSDNVDRVLRADRGPQRMEASPTPVRHRSTASDDEDDHIVVSHDNGRTCSAHLQNLRQAHHGPIVRQTGGRWIAFALMNKPHRGAGTELPERPRRGTMRRLHPGGEPQGLTAANNTLFADSWATSPC